LPICPAARRRRPAHERLDDHRGAERPDPAPAGPAPRSRHARARRSAAHTRKPGARPLPGRLAPSRRLPGATRAGWCRGRVCSRAAVDRTPDCCYDGRQPGADLMDGQRDPRLPAQAARIAERLAAARGQRFVGRRSEIELFRAALTAPEPPFALLFLYGPGGVGKTTLLDAYARLTAEDGIPSARIDGRAIEPSPSGFLLAL